jgi:purine-binding chemotaxis protein CheW
MDRESGATGAGRTVGFGGFRVAGTALALPMEALREVVPLTTLLPLPCDQPSVMGGLPLRGALVPVLDLRHWLQRERVQIDSPCVVIVVHEGRLVGLLAEAVTGVFQCSVNAMVPFSAADTQGLPLSGAGLLAGSLLRDDTLELLCVLSPAGLARWPGIPWVDDPEPQRQSEAMDEAQADPMTADRPVMLLRCGGVALAIDALAVHTTVDSPVLQPSALVDGCCLGVIETGGRRIPAIDLAAYCGLPAMQPQQVRQALFLELPHGPIACLVELVIDVLRVPHQAVLPAPKVGGVDARLWSGILPRQALPPEVMERAGAWVSQFLLIDGPQLLRDNHLDAIAEVSGGMAPVRSVSRAAGLASAAQAVPQAGTVVGGLGATVRGATTRSMICFSIGHDALAPIEQISEIVPFDQELSLLPVGGAFKGLLTRRGRTLPVYCLSLLAGRTPPPPEPTASILVVCCDGDWVGFSVDALLGIEVANWEPSLPRMGAGAPAGDTVADLMSGRQLAQIGTEPATRLLPVVDLLRLGQLLLASTNA